MYVNAYAIKSFDNAPTLILATAVRALHDKSLKSATPGWQGWRMMIFLARARAAFVHEKVLAVAAGDAPGEVGGGKMGRADGLSRERIGSWDCCRLGANVNEVLRDGVVLPSARGVRRCRGIGATGLVGSARNGGDGGGGRSVSGGGGGVKSCCCKGCRVSLVSLVSLVGLGIDRQANRSKSRDAPKTFFDADSG